MVYILYDVVTCTGKSGMVASRFAASLGSLGIPAHFVHAGEWTHGDLGEHYFTGSYAHVHVRGVTSLGDLQARPRLGVMWRCLCLIVVAQKSA